MIRLLVQSRQNIEKEYRRDLLIRPHIYNKLWSEPIGALG